MPHDPWFNSHVSWLNPHISWLNLVAKPLSQGEDVDASDSFCRGEPNKMSTDGRPGEAGEDEDAHVEKCMRYLYDI